MAFLDTSRELKIDLVGRPRAVAFPIKYGPGRRAWRWLPIFPALVGAGLFSLIRAPKRSQPTAFFHHDNGRRPPHLHLVEALLQQHHAPERDGQLGTDARNGHYYRLPAYQHDIRQLGHGKAIGDTGAGPPGGVLSPIIGFASPPLRRPLRLLRRLVGSSTCPSQRIAP
jgi:hypothetical protein